MLSWFKGASHTRGTARKLYGAVVTQARRPEFYADLRVPDTPEGRYELVALHLVLLLERLSHEEGPPAKRLGQVLSEVFVIDMDDNMREMGVGDLTVPRKVKKAAAGLFERALRYRLALAPQAGQADLGKVLAENFLSEGGGDIDVAGLSAYVRRAAAAMIRTPSVELHSGEVAFPAVT